MTDSKIEMIAREIGEDSESYLKAFFQYFLFKRSIFSLHGVKLFTF